MFQTILVPLDGSALAEQALPLAIGVTQRRQAALRLATIHRPNLDEQAADVAIFRAEQEYLNKTAARVRHHSNLSVSTDVLEEGTVASALCAFAGAVGADLIVLTTHGRGPLSRFWLGSVTDELLRTSPIPLLVHRPADGAAPDLNADIHIRRILVPLDGSDFAEKALAPAAELAVLFGAELLLFRVVVPAPVLVPDESASLRSAMEGPVLENLSLQARSYLDRTARRLRTDRLQVDVRVAVNVSPAAAVLEAAPLTDLIALTTHGIGKVARFFLGSVADKVVRGSLCPVLVVPRPVLSDGTGQHP
jgi:nucleotide-binding universal stress UspA family protein